MTKAAILERDFGSMKRADHEEISMILERLEKLSRRPENPGLAYRNLETINALMETLRQKLSVESKISG